MSWHSINVKLMIYRLFRKSSFYFGSTSWQKIKIGSISWQKVKIEKIYLINK